MAKVPANDWRRFRQDRYLLRAKLALRAWRQSWPHWDHDHCEFCWAKFMSAGYPDTLSAGYCTLDEYRWICPRCYKDFRDEFQFELVLEVHPPSLQELKAQILNPYEPE
jgi:hypothetical protein